MKMRRLIFSSSAPQGHSRKIRNVIFRGHYSMKIRRLNFSSYAPGALLDENKEVKYFE